MLFACQRACRLLRVAACAVLPLLAAGWGAPARAEGGYSVAMVLPRAEGPIEAAFKDYFAKSGIELHTTVLRYSGDPVGRGALRAELRRLRPDLVYTWGTPTTLAVAGPMNAPPGGDDALRDIPIVFASVSDPVSAGLLTRADRPGRNLTGASHLAPLPVQLKTIRAYRPFQRLGFIYNPGERNATQVRDQLRERARAEGFELIEAAVPADATGQPDAAALPALVQQLQARKADFLYIGPDTFVGLTHRDAVTAAALQARLPTFSAIESTVRGSRALMGLVSPQANVGRFAALKALRILQHTARIEEEPVQTLQSFSLLINLEVARALDLYPPLLLLNAAEVVGGAVPL